VADCVRSVIARLIAVALLAAACGQAAAQPSESDIATYRAKLAEYVAKGAEPDVIAKGLQGWFGWPFIARPDYVAGTMDYLVKAPVNGVEIRYLRTIGSVSNAYPLVLIPEGQSK
jgi:hypothetical protein